MRRAVLSVVLALAAPASALAAPPVRLALIEDESQIATVRLAEPVERALRDAPDAVLLASEVVECELRGLDVRCRLPPRAGAPALDSSEAAVLEDESEFAFVFPPDDGFIEAVRRAAADPSTFRSPYAFHLDDAEGDVSLGRTAEDGAREVFLRPKLRRPVGLKARRTLAAYYRVRWKGRELSFLAVGRVLGGVGRLATAAERWAESGPWLGVSRGGSFGGGSSDARGRALLDPLERAGLRWSAAGASELEHWETLQDYRRERPDGVSFLSVNLVKAGTSERVLPAYAVHAASGVRVALVGATSVKATAASPALKRAGLEVRDPTAALKELLPELRAKADVVVLLAELAPEEEDRASHVLGVDLYVGQSGRFFQFSDGAEAVHVEKDRPEYASPFPILRLHRPAFDRIEIERGPGRSADWRVTHAAKLLDDGVAEADGFPAFDFAAFATGFSTGPALLPSSRDVLGPSRPFYRSREFWTLAAGMLAERAKAEAGILAILPLEVSGVGEVPEPYVRAWLSRRDDPVLVTLTGAQLKELADEAAAEAAREAGGLPPGSKPRFAVAGFDDRGRVRGSPLELSGTYRVAASAATVELLKLDGPVEPVKGYGSLADAVLEELRRRAAGARAEHVRAWMEGKPVTAPGLWKINVRDLGVNLRQTKVVRGDEFDAVPNARIQAFDERLAGYVLKADADWLKREYKWGNTVELEYAKSRVQPRNAPAVTNLAANRIMVLTLGTRRAGGIPYPWLARSWGPSLGLQYDGEFESLPGQRRRQVYSAFPGLEFFDGEVVNSLSASGIVKRDLSREPFSTQTGVRARMLLTAPVGPVARLQAELWNNYFFLTRRDLPTDLRLEGAAVAKLVVPIRRHFSISPFVDFYWFQLKTRPSSGYSVMTGINVGFSRLWKPQYEPF